MLYFKPAFSCSFSTSSREYEKNQIPSNYTVEVTNRFKGLELVERVPEELWTDVHNSIQKAGPKNHTKEKEIQEGKKKKKPKKAKWLSEEALQIAEKKREVKGKRESERYTQLNAEIRRDKKAFLNEQCKEIETIEWERLEITSRKLEIPREHFMQ